MQYKLCYENMHTSAQVMFLFEDDISENKWKKFVE